jgi:hypothetical protein
MFLRAVGRHVGIRDDGARFGALIDGVLEWIAIGTRLLVGGAIGLVAVPAVFPSFPPMDRRGKRDPSRHKFSPERVT